MHLLKNKYFILGNLFLILAAIPLTLFLIRSNQGNSSQAAPSTVLSLTPATVTATKNLQFPMDVVVDPGQNLVANMSLHFKYDPTKLELVKIEPNSAVISGVPLGPSISSGQASITLTTGIDATKAIQTKTKVATLTFKPIAVSAEPTLVTFDFAPQTADSAPQSLTKVLSVRGNQEGTCSTPNLDCPGQNVLSSALPASVTISDGIAAVTPTVAPATTPLPAAPVIPTGAPTATATPAIQAVNQPPSCSGLSTDRDINGIAPYSLMFTGNGSDTGGTITKATFNFGDGPIQDISQSGGIGTSNVSVQVAHVFQNPGTYQVTVVFTDNLGGVSSVSPICTKTITVSRGSAANATGNNTGGVAPTTAPDAPKPTLAATGSIGSTLGVVGGIILTIIGGALLLTL